MPSQISWRRVFVEGLVIVASILLAFAIDAWWDAHQERRQQAGVLELLHSDLVTDTIELGFAFEYAPRHMRAASWLLNYWDRTEVPSDSISEAVRQFQVWNLVQLQDAAFNGLQAGDRLRLIQNDSLRATVVEYFAVTHPLIEQGLGEIDQERRKLLDHSSPYFRWRRSGPDNAETYMRLDVSWGELQRDRRIPNLVSDLVSAWNRSLQFRDSAVEQNARLRGLIESELQHLR